MKTSVFVLALLGGTSAAALAAADEVHQLEPIRASESALGDAPMVSDPQPTPKSSITRAGLDLLGGPAQTSLYAPLDLMPSIIEASPDPFGLSPTREINIRGKDDFHLTRDINGLPLSGIVGGTDLFDLENVRQEDVYRGGLASNQGLGVSNASGAIDQQLLTPQDRFGVLGKQALGSFDFHRTFARVDTGALSDTGTSAFVSGSFTGADKWTGLGNESRKNVMLAVNQQFGDTVKVDFDTVYNKFMGNSYRSLTYSQTQSLRGNYSYDYNPVITGVSANDVNFYQFNRSQYEDYAALAKIDVKLAEGHHIIIKPYYWNDNGVTYSASGSNVQIWQQQNDNYGGVLEYNGHYGAATEVVAGYWVESMEPPPPPTDQTKYTVNANGNLAFASWSTLAKIDRFVVNSPYAQVTQAFDQTVLSGGVRYMDLGAPKMQYYKTAGLPNVSYDQVWGYNPTPDTNAAVVAKTYGQTLPNIGIRQDLSPEWSASASYGRKFGRPDWGPQASNYISNEAAFVAKGVSLQSLVDRVKPELSDQVDLSIRYKSGGLTLVPTVFGAKNQNRQVMVTDPALGGLSYYQGTAATTQYGAELEGEWQIGEAWSIFGSGTLVSETYDADTPTLSGGATLATRGKQIPNAPKSMFKGGLTYRWDDLSVSPITRFIGDRYGDSAQTQLVKSYTVFDFNATYNLGHDVGLETLSAGLSMLNLFNRRYVSEISPNDTQLNGATAYYVGAPRTIVGTVSVKF